MIPKALSQYRTLIQIIIIYTLFVILWGAWVRISGSGDGCGESWPLCHGQVIPQDAEGKTWVELAHRATSGLYGFFVIGFVILTFRRFPQGHVNRKLAVTALVFTILEALIGARIVLAGLVGTNASFDRGFIMAIHLLNTFFLTGSLVLAHEFSLYKKPKWQSPEGLSSWLSQISIAGFVVVGMSGAFAALSTTLYPSESLLSGLAQDFDSSAPLFIRLRAFHPLAAIVFIVGLYPIALKWLAATQRKAAGRRENRGQQGVKILIGFVIFTGLVGLLNLLLLSPLWLKLTHLLAAQILWILLLAAILAIYVDETDKSDTRR